MQTEMIIERATLSRGRVDAVHGVVHGVKILSPISKNGRTYAAEAIRQAVPLYEGAKVNLNHPAGSPSSPRDYRDRFGSIRNVRLASGELVGDLHYNVKHPVAEQFAWDAEHSPSNVGLSHNVVASTSRRNGSTVVESITKVQSVDLVADPATTNGLFEHADDAAETLEEITTARFVAMLAGQHLVTESSQAEFIHAIR